MKFLKGYNFSRPFLGERAPESVQTIVNNHFCEKNNYRYILHSTEYNGSNSSQMLFAEIKNIKKYDGFLFYSILMLPIDSNKRKLLYKKIIDNKKELHFAVEDLSIKSKKDISKIEQLFLLRKKIFERDVKSHVLGNEKNYVTFRHLKSKRDYLGRVNKEKIYCMKIAKKYSKEYWDGPKKFGYGGYRYIENYHKFLAAKLINDYNLNANSKILDVGCGKGYLVYEISKILKSKNVFGCDISKYAIKNSKKEIKKNIFYHDARKNFKFKDDHFDFIFSNTTLHNFRLKDCEKALKEIERIAVDKYICVESFTDEKEQFNVQSWALTAETLVHKESWLWLFEKSGYTGDYEFIYFK